MGFEKSNLSTQHESYVALSLHLIEKKETSTAVGFRMALFEILSLKFPCVVFIF